MKIICDTREQAPYAFTGQKYAGTVVEAGTLQTGDYSLAGLTDHIALERKSLSDLTGTLTRGRERFQRECERGRGLDYFGLVSAIALKCGQCKGSPLAAAACTDDTCPLSRFGPGCIFELPTLLEQYQAQTSQQGEMH